MRPALDLSLYLVLDSALCGERGIVPTLRAAVRGGVSAVQVREPQAGTRQLCRIVETVQQALIGSDVALLVNDRLDVALALGADGVHLGQSDLPAAHARRVAGPDLLIGLSVSNLAEAQEAAALVAGTVDYLGVGPVFATATKPGAAPPMGLRLTTEVCAVAPLPCVAIGGIGPANAAAVRRTGAAGIAVVSAICAAPDPEAAAAALGRPESAHRGPGSSALPPGSSALPPGSTGASQ